MSNPVLEEKYIEKFQNYDNGLEVVSTSGVALKVMFLFAIMLVTSYLSFKLAIIGSDRASILSMAGIIIGGIFAFATIFIRNFKLLAPLSMGYALFEGLAIGAISGWFTTAYGSGIVLNAVLASFATLFAVMFLYSTKIIRCTEKFKSVIFASTLAIAIVYFITIIMSFINPESTSVLMGNGLMGIGFSVVVCIVAALNFVIDFDIIDRAKEAGLTKDFEWYGAFSILVTLIWLYIEILKLLAKLNKRQ